MRLLLAMPDPGQALAAALLREGHEVQACPVVSGPIAAWRAQRAVAAFRPDAVLADGAQGEALARRLGLPVHVPDRGFLPPPPAPLAFLVLNDPPEQGFPAPGPPPPAWWPDIVVLTEATLDQAPRWMAAARVLVAPDVEPARALLADGETALLHPPGDPAPALARLFADAALRLRLSLAAHAAYLDRHARAWAALEAALPAP